ncbi:hypothetical protein H310_04957 [Aphanomyces invadans]|uniref:BAG domain-containing protein n=1 Tax=Aphanomyces invadans TaxID=157072 RepID=A0A024UAT3_9STRA|nr:hypothetical protein H310_04957 [Aphanomyces invadans]ETW03516.1 hypothetical protein H310_04957 [Aphanomyces invadans]|eukprot:XP_008867745.1 hypothetical protein H310_04957 [Aphanomyces invadans]
MTTNAMKARSQLAVVKEHVDRIHDILTTRLPNQHGIIAAELAATKWLCVAHHDNAPTHVKKCKLQVSNYRFRVLEQGERLTRLLCDLDLVESDGDMEIRQERKRLVLRIQDELVLADAMKVRCDKLVDFHATLFPSSDAATDGASTLNVTSDNLDATEEEETARAEDVNNDEMDSNDQTDDHTSEVDDDECDDEDMDNEEEDEGAEEESHIPEWTPRYEVHEGRDGAVYLLADLTGVDLNRHLDVQIDGDVLRVTGTKLPTPRDLQVMRMTGQPTFGRFVIAESFPSHLFNLHGATLRRAAGGVVEVRIPRARAVYNPFFPRSYAASQRRATPFANMGLAW